MSNRELIEELRQVVCIDYEGQETCHRAAAALEAMDKELEQTINLAWIAKASLENRAAEMEHSARECREVARKMQKRLDPPPAPEGE